VKVGCLEAEDLVFLRAVPVNRYALAFELVGRQIYLSYVVDGGVGREVYGLGDGVVGVFLEGGLDGEVLRGGDIEGSNEESFDVGGDAFDFTE